MLIETIPTYIHINLKKLSGGQLQLTITRIKHHNPKTLREYILKKTPQPDLYINHNTSLTI